MNYDIDPAKAKAAMDALVAELRAQNTPETLAKRADAERARKYRRGISYQRQCDARDAVVLATVR